jgi:hypothetical protein
VQTLQVMVCDKVRVKVRGSVRSGLGLGLGEKLGLGLRRRFGVKN